MTDVGFGGALVAAVLEESIAFERWRPPPPRPAGLQAPTTGTVAGESAAPESSASASSAPASWPVDCHTSGELPGRGPRSADGSRSGAVPTAGHLFERGEEVRNVSAYGACTPLPEDREGDVAEAMAVMRDPSVTRGSRLLGPEVAYNEPSWIRGRKPAISARITSTTSRQERGSRLHPQSMPPSTSSSREKHVSVAVPTSRRSTSPGPRQAGDTTPADQAPRACPKRRCAARKDRSTQVRIVRDVDGARRAGTQAVDDEIAPGVRPGRQRDRWRPGFRRAACPDGHPLRIGPACLRTQRRELPRRSAVSSVARRSSRASRRVGRNGTGPGTRPRFRPRLRGPLRPQGRSRYAAVAIPPAVQTPTTARRFLRRPSSSSVEPR